MIQSYFRMVASAVSVISYMLLVNGHTTYGVVANLMCQVLLVPFAMKSKAYDMVGLSAFFGGVNIHVLVTTWIT